MKQLVRTSLFTMAIALSMLSTSAVDASVVIYEASPTNTTTIGNVFNGTDNAPLTTVTGVLPNLVVTNAGTDFSNSGFESTDDIDALLAAASLPALISTDTLTYSLTVDSMTGALRSNGIHFGSSTGAITGTGTGLFAHLDGPNSGDNIEVLKDGVITDTGFDYVDNPSFSASSIVDGFSIEITADSAGYSIAFSDILTTSGATSVTETGTFAGTEFVDEFSAGHFYLTGQRFNGAAPLVFNISEASIHIDSLPIVVPEPSSIALLSLTGLLALRRRRS